MICRSMTELNMLSSWWLDLETMVLVESMLAAWNQLLGA